MARASTNKPYQIKETQPSQKLTESKEFEVLLDSQREFINRRFKDNVPSEIFDSNDKPGVSFNSDLAVEEEDQHRRRNVAQRISVTVDKGPKYQAEYSI